MKHLIIAAAVALLCAASAFGQAKKPTLMVIPSDTWCQEGGFTKSYDVMGEAKTVPDYDKALLGSGDLKVAITVINGLMADRGFPLVDLEQSVKSISTASAETMATTSKDGMEIAVSPLDMIKQRAKCDIVIDLYWKVNAQGPRRSLTYNLRALDAYTNKQIASTTGTGEPTMTSELSLMLQTAIEGSIEEFTGRLMTFFTDMEANGREVALDIQTWDGSPYDLDSETDTGDLLIDLIEDWVAGNTVNGVYSLTDATSTMMEFDQVRIPLYDEGGRALDTRRWARGLSKLLRTNGIDNRLAMRGLGQATIIIGGK